MIITFILLFIPNVLTDTKIISIPYTLAFHRPSIQSSFNSNNDNINIFLNTFLPFTIVQESYYEKMTREWKVHHEVSLHLHEDVRVSHFKTNIETSAFFISGMSIYVAKNNVWYPDRGLGLGYKFDDEEFLRSHYVVFATKNGTVKKTCLEAYSRPRANGVIAINIVEGDEVVDVRLTNGHNELILANRNGRAVRFDENEIRTMGRTSTGVRGMRLDEGNDAVVGMIVVNDPEKETVMVVSEQGYGKRSDVLDYRVTKRGGKGVKTLNITDKTGRLVAIKNVTDDNDLMIINQSGIVIRLAVADCRVMGRATQGVRLINLAKKNDVIASVCKVMSSELEASVEEESRSAWAKKSEEIENDTVGAKTAEEAAEAEAHLADEASEAEDTDSGNVDIE